MNKKWSKLFLVCFISFSLSFSTSVFAAGGTLKLFKQSKSDSMFQDANLKRLSWPKPIKLESRNLYAFSIDQESQEEEKKSVADEYAERLAKIETLKKAISKKKSQKGGYIVAGIVSAGLSAVLFYKLLTGEMTVNDKGEEVLSSGQKFGLYGGIISAAASSIFLTASININKKLYAKKRELKKYEQEFALKPLPESQLYDVEAEVPKEPELTEDEREALIVKKQDMSRQRRIEMLQKQIKDIRNYQTVYYLTSAGTGIIGVVFFFKSLNTLFDVDKEFSKSQFAVGLLGICASYFLFHAGIGLNKKIIKHRKEMREIEKEKYKKVFSMSLFPIKKGFCLSLSYSF